MSEYRHIANLAGPQGDRGQPGIGSHGVISEPTDLDGLARPGDMGTYAIRSENMINGPNVDTTGPMLLTVEYAALNACTQTITTRDRVWRRKSTGAETWAGWFRVDSPSVGSLIGEERDVDQMNRREHAGTYAVRVGNMVNGPDVEGNPVGVLAVTWGGAQNVVSQTFTTTANMWWRNIRTVDPVSWHPWRRHVTADEVADLDGIISSPTVRRIITSTDPDAPLEDGDLLLVVSEETA